MSKEKGWCKGRRHFGSCDGKNIGGSGDGWGMEDYIVVYHKHVGGDHDDQEPDTGKDLADDEEFVDCEESEDDEELVEGKGVNEYEMGRTKNVEENRRKMRELGLPSYWTTTWKQKQDSGKVTKTKNGDESYYLGNDDDQGTKEEATSKVHSYLYLNHQFNSTIQAILIFSRNLCQLIVES